MLDLLSKYSFSQILIFIVILALAIKSVISFIDWAIEHIRKLSNKEYKKKIKESQIEKHLSEQNALIRDLQAKQKDTDSILDKLSKKIDMLIASDRDAIKAYITRQHHLFCYEKKWIDDFSLECLENRYAHYVEQGGNHFIKGFMEELRSLPKQPPNI